MWKPETKGKTKKLTEQGKNGHTLQNVFFHLSVALMLQQVVSLFNLMGKCFCWPRKERELNLTKMVMQVCV